MPKGRLPKNARNYAKWKAEQERGPVRTFFHITTNERLPAIKREGLRANSQFANVNSADNPFRELGVEGGGNWVTQHPGAFPVYGTLIGGKNGDVAARADALSTLKIEIPVDKLPEIRAVKDPYGANMHLTKASNKRLFTKFPAWDDSDARVAVLLEDIPPEQLTDLGYVEHSRGDLRPVWDYFYENSDLNQSAVHRGLPKVERRALSNATGHDRAVRNQATSPSRYAIDFLNLYVPITERRGRLPSTRYDSYKDAQFFINQKRQRGDAMYDDWHDVQGKRYGYMPTADEWNREYIPPIPFGKLKAEVSEPEFHAGAISRGMGRPTPITERYKFDWNKYNELINEGTTPWEAAERANTTVRLDWDNIKYNVANGYVPVAKPVSGAKLAYGSVSRGLPEIYLEGKPIMNKRRYFRWPEYRDAIARGESPNIAAQLAAPNYQIKWNPPGAQTEYEGTYIPREAIAEGHISRGEAPTIEPPIRRVRLDQLHEAIDPYINDNIDLFRNEFKMPGVPDDVIRELSRLELRNDIRYHGHKVPPVVKSWAELENPDILRKRQQGLDALGPDAWLYKILTGQK